MTTAVETADARSTCSTQIARPISFLAVATSESVPDVVPLVVEVGESVLIFVAGLSASFTGWHSKAIKVAHSRHAFPRNHRAASLRCRLGCASTRVGDYH